MDKGQCRKEMPTTPGVYQPACDCFEKKHHFVTHRACGGVGCSECSWTGSQENSTGVSSSTANLHLSQQSSLSFICLTYKIRVIKSHREKIECHVSYFYTCLLYKYTFYEL